MGNLPSITLEISTPPSNLNLIFDLLFDISIGLLLCSNREINWKIVFFGKIIGSIWIFWSISILLEESLWLSVATPHKNDLFSNVVLCR